MIDFDFEPLRRIGLTAAMARHLSLSVENDGEPSAHPIPQPPTVLDPAPSPLHILRVTEVHRDRLRLHDGRAEHVARVVPWLRRELSDGDSALAVGDWVRAAPDAHGDWQVHRRLPPLTHLVRRDADGSRHAVVSNVDTALLVMGLDDDFNPRRLERYLALVRGSGVTPVLVLSKADAAAPARIDEAMRRLQGRTPPDLDRHVVDARSPAAAQALAPYLQPGRTLVLLGSSGAGKSTLTNTLAGRELQDTGAVRENDRRGKHTTTSRSLHPLPGGACVIDTPGLRALRPDLDEATLSGLFDDVARFAAMCRFRDCRHHDEPGCAVRAGVDDDRLRNFHKLLREARRDTLTVLDRQRELAQWKARGRAARVALRHKRGDD